MNPNEKQGAKQFSIDANLVQLGHCIWYDATVDGVR